jgi:hypothetical protein
MFIEFFALIGWATDLKTVPHNVIVNRILRTGDESHILSEQQREIIETVNIQENSHFWGFGDKEMTIEDLKNVKILRNNFQEQIR